MELLKVNDLRTYFQTTQGIARAVDGVSFSIEAEESVAIVGESACGKSVTARSIMRLIQGPQGFHPSGQIFFEGQDLFQKSQQDLQTIRGNQISMIFQEPMTSLNPVFSIGNQLREPLMLHQGMAKQQAHHRSIELLEQMGIAEPRVVLQSYPHQLSGGMRQRVMIAMAIACHPKLMIADEPTTALDVTVQSQILNLIRSLQKEIGMALILITHDLGVVNQMSDRVITMYSGQIVEMAPCQQLLQTPKHPYTAKLLESIPRGIDSHEKLRVIRGMVRPATHFSEGCRFAERCDYTLPRCEEQVPSLFSLNDQRGVACHLYDPQDPLPHASSNDQTIATPPASTTKAIPLITLENLSTHIPVKRGFFQRVAGHIKAVDGISLQIHECKTLGLVGESGCGKTTLGHSLLKLNEYTQGKVYFQGKDIFSLSPQENRQIRRKMQIIFQDPFSSLNPRWSVQQIVGEGLKVHEPELPKETHLARIQQVLDEVGLPDQIRHRYAHEFSGGQRQRIAIARALILRPQFIVLDESTSALDVSVQAQILNLLQDLQQKHALTYLFITHDLGVVQYMADEVAIMYLGRIVEYGATKSIFANPQHPYTKALLAASPQIDKPSQLTKPISGDVPSPITPPQGCHFHPRCPILQQSPAFKKNCLSQFPQSHSIDEHHWVKCHVLFSH